MRHRRLLTRTALPLAVLAWVAVGSTSALGQSPESSVSLTVSIDGVSALAPGPEIPQGLPMTLVFTATNTGSERLSDLALTDSLLGPIDCSPATIDPGQSATCERDTEAVAGRYRSRAAVSAEAPDGGAVGATVRVGYRGLRLKWVADVDLEVLADGIASGWPGPTLIPGDQVVFTYRVSNRGTVPLFRIKVFDPQGLKAVCPVRTVDPGQSVECRAVGTVIDGRFKQDAVVRAWDARDVRVQDRQRIHYLGERPIVPAGFEAVALAGGVAAAEGRGPMIRADRPVAWGIEVINTGEDDLWGLYAEDSEEGRLECGERHLAPGSATRCTVWGRAIGGPMAGEIRVTAWATDGRQITRGFERHAFGYRPGADLLIETFVDGFDADVHAGPRRPLGSSLDLTYVVHNTGTDTLRQVTVRDALFGAIDCPTRFMRSGETMVCAHTVTAELGWWETAGTAKGRSGAESVRDSDKTFWHVRTTSRVSRIDLGVTVAGVDTDGKTGHGFVAGDVVEIVYLASNAGNSPLWSMEIRDPNVDPAAMTCSGSRDPLPGAALRCTAALVVQSGEHWYQIEAVAWNSDGTRISGTASVHYLGVAGPT